MGGKNAKDIDTKKIREIIHKVNSPITTIMGYSELIQRRFSQGIDGSSDANEKIVKWVKAIHDEALRIKDFVKELSGEIPKNRPD